MPPIEVPGRRGGRAASPEEEFDEDELQAFMSNSLPEHVGMLVGSLGGSMPRSLTGWPTAREVYRPPLPPGDVESGRFSFFPPGEEPDGHEEGLGGEESDEEKLESEPSPGAVAAAGLPGPAHAGMASEPTLADLAPAGSGDGLSAAAEHHGAADAASGSVAGSGRKAEAIRILRLAAPLSVSNLAGYAISMIAIAAVGRLGDYSLSVVVLATSVYNVTGLSILIGFSSAMETFCGQAYGAGRYHLVGLVLQRALLLLTLLAAVVAAVWTQAEPILLALGQDAAIAHGTGQFLKRAAPALFFTAYFEALKRYLMAQEAVRPPTVVTCVALALAPLYNWLLIFKLGMGLYGAAYAMVAMQATLAGLLALYCAARDYLLAGNPLATWHGFTAKAWSGWWQYCRFALPSVAMLCCEWSTFEVMVLMSGLLPDPSVCVSAMGLVINTSGMSYMIVTGLACATSVRTGHSLGAGKPGEARRATWTAWSLTMCLQTLVAIGITLGRNLWPYLFTNSAPVVQRTADLLPLFALSLFGDGTNAVLQGLLRGAGRQHMGAITNLLSYWCCGIPLAAYLAFRRGLGLEGLWWGLVVINTLQGGIMLTMAALFDFEGQAEKAAAIIQQAAARLEAETANPMLQPLLDGGGEGSSGSRQGGSAAAGTAADGAAATPAGQAGKGRQMRRRSAAAPGRRAADPEGIKQRLSLALLLLLTDGVPNRVRGQQAAAGSGGASGQARRQP